MITQSKKTTIDKSIPITNNYNILNWLCNNITSAHNDTKINLTANLVPELTNIFGKYNTTFKSEFLMKIWILEYDDLVFNIFTAPKKGTSIEIVNSSYEDIRNNKYQSKIIFFLEELYELINKNNL